MMRPPVCVLTAPGINCNEETAFAFELAGGAPEQVHISQLRSGEKRLRDFAIVALSGGFSHGDDIASGRILGLEFRTQLADEMNDFVEHGGLGIGICNGFQVLVESGLLPDGKTDVNAPKTASLAHNRDGGFQCRWTKLRINETKSVFIDPDLAGEVIELPVAHGEGQFLRRDEAAYDYLFDNDQVVFQYWQQGEGITEEFPYNPNGSPRGITGISDPTGQILGMMPHPERFVRPEQYVNYHRSKALGELIVPQGLAIFKTGVEHARTS